MSIRTFATIAISLIIGVSCTSVADNSLKADGIGPVRLGAVINSLPKSSEGLYDRIEPERVEEFDYEGTVYHLVLQGERIVTLIEDNGKIHAIEVYSDKVQTADGFILRFLAQRHCQHITANNPTLGLVHFHFYLLALIFAEEFASIEFWYNVHPGESAFCLTRDTHKMSVDVLQAFLPAFQGYVCKVNVNRITR